MPLTRWQDWTGAAVVTLMAAGLVAADLADTGFRRWWAARPLTTSTLTGLLVLLITLLVADQVVRMRQIRDRSRAVAAQAAFLVAQAARAARAVSSALDGRSWPRPETRPPQTRPARRDQRTYSAAPATAPAAAPGRVAGQVCGLMSGRVSGRASSPIG